MPNDQPTERHLVALRRMAQHEAGRPAVIVPADAEECEDRGWAEAQPGGGYRLTEAGRNILASEAGNRRSIDCDHDPSWAGGRRSRPAILR